MSFIRHFPRLILVQKQNYFVMSIYFKPQIAKVFQIHQLKIMWLYVLIMSRTRFRVNPHSIVAWMSGTPCSKQARNRKFKWLQLESNPLDWVFVYELNGCWFESSCSHWTIMYGFERTNHDIHLTFYLKISSDTFCMSVIWSNNILYVYVAIKAFFFQVTVFSWIFSSYLCVHFNKDIAGAAKWIYWY